MKAVAVRGAWLPAIFALLPPLILPTFPSTALAADMEADASAPASNLAARALGVDVSAAASLTDEQALLAKSIGKDVVCLCGTCPKHTITDCTCGWAGLNQRAIQNAVASGRTRSEIVQAYRSSYGDQVLAMLPNEGFAKAGWAVPYVSAIVGLAVVFLIGLRMRRRRGIADALRTAEGAAGAGAAGGADETRAQLARELEELD